MLRQTFPFSLFLLCAAPLLPVSSLHSALPAPLHQSTQEAEDLYLRELLNDFFELQLKFDPEAATYLGRDNSLNSLWSDLSDADLEERLNVVEAFTSALKKINPDTLSHEARIEYELFKRSLQETKAFLNTDLQWLPLSQMGGPPLEVFPVLLSMPCSSITHYQRILDRLKGIPKLIDQTIDLMQRGLDKGITFPRYALRALPGNFKKVIAPPPEESLFYIILNDPAMDSDDLAAAAIAIRAEALEAIAQEVYPAYQKLADFITDIYLPNCREEIGLCALPGGKELYRLLVAKYTTTSLSPEEIHRLGLAEVERIHSEMEQVIRQSGYEGSVDDYLHYLATDPSFYFTDKESLLEGYRALTQSIRQQLPNLFGLIPSLPFEVLPVPSHTEEGQITAYYMPGSAATGRPGQFFVNTSDIETRPKWQMESLALHEAVPGHHFQISLTQEIEGMCEFRRHYNCTAYIEGWGLYSESLGPDFGLGKSPSAKVGCLIEEMMRAVRLVVDTGIHEYGWTRSQAINYMMEHTGFHEREAATEIDRYCVIPAQALAYKVGELSMQRWKREAREKLEDAFDIRAFHDVLLGNGTLPLDLCEEIIYDWLNAAQ